MITFTISSFLLTLFSVIVAGIVSGVWLILSTEQREKWKKDRQKKK